MSTALENMLLPIFHDHPEWLQSVVVVRPKLPSFRWARHNPAILALAESYLIRTTGSAIGNRKHSARPRPSTINISKLSRTARENILAGKAASKVADLERPRIRAECGPRSMRPCPFLLCRNHLAIEISQEGHIKMNFPDLDIENHPENLKLMRHTCAIDAAEEWEENRQGNKEFQDWEDIGLALNLGVERVRQHAATGLAQVRRRDMQADNSDRMRLETAQAVRKRLNVIR